MSVNAYGSCIHRRLQLPFISMTCSSKKTPFIPIWLLLQFCTSKRKFRDKSRLSLVTEKFFFPLSLFSYRWISVSIDTQVTNSVHGPDLFCHFVLPNTAFCGISSFSVVAPLYGPLHFCCGWLTTDFSNIHELTPESLLLKLELLQSLWQNPQLLHGSGPGRGAWSRMAGSNTMITIFIVSKGEAFFPAQPEEYFFLLDISRNRNLRPFKCSLFACHAHLGLLMDSRLKIF